jgi:hypothetical protein
LFPPNPYGLAHWSKIHATGELARLLQLHGRQRQLGESAMKILMTALLLIVAASQYACAPLVAGGVGAAVGVAAERERQEDKEDD